MKILIVLFTTVFSLSSFADCPDGDPNCVMRSNGAGTNVIGLDCPGCRALEKSSYHFYENSYQLEDGASRGSSSSGTTDVRK